MFSGIIKKTSKASAIKKRKESMEVKFPLPKGWKLTLGESVNIDGVCSTVKDLTSKTFDVYYMPETLDKTTMGNLSSDHTFNLERCLTLNELISGHLVYGHVDTTAKVASIESAEDSKVIKFTLPANFTKYIVYKGSISVNGVSLTIVTVDKNSFSVSLIPHTLENTNLDELIVGDKVNIEVDMLAKQIEKLIKHR